MRENILIIGMALTGIVGVISVKACTPDDRQRALDAGRCKVSTILREAPSARELTVDDLREVASRLKACHE
jgi:hypothetical protein